MLQLRNRTKKEQKDLDSIIGFLVLVAGLSGWYIWGTLKGVGISVGIALGIIIVFSVWKSGRYKKRLQQSGIAEIDQMTGRQFEEYIGTLFGNHGYRVKYTPATGDFGADLILKKGREVIVVQAKRYKGSVGIAAVQEVIPAVKMYNANAAWVVSNSYYTKAAVKLAKSNHVRMIDRDQLIQMSIDENLNKSVRSLETRDQLIENVADKQFSYNEEPQVAATLEVDSVNISAVKLETLLKEYRLKKSRQSGMKAFHIFTNKTLSELVEIRPATIDELRGVKGIGEKKIEDFGEELLMVIRELKI
jgi:restriction system protein